MKNGVKKMTKKTQQPTYDDLCQDCLEPAVERYLSLSSLEGLRELKEQIAGHIEMRELDYEMVACETEHYYR